MLTYSWLQSNFHKSDYIDLYFSKRSSWKSLINWRNLHKNIFKLSLTQFFSLRGRIMCKCFGSVSVWKHKSIGNQTSDWLTHQVNQSQAWFPKHLHMIRPQKFTANILSTRALCDFIQHGFSRICHKQYARNLCTYVSLQNCKTHSSVDKNDPYLHRKMAQFTFRNVLTKLLQVARNLLKCREFVFSKITVQHS